jgi:transposase
MAMGTRKQREKQEGLWIAQQELASAPGHPFYQKLNELLEAERFDEFVEKRCAKFYAAKYGRPSLTPGIYFRALLIGYFEGIGAERGIAWRLADSLALRRFVGIALDEYTPDHSTISRTRRLIDVDTHREVFAWVLGVLADHGLLQGQRIAIDATTLEANAAMRSIVRRDTGASYEEFLRGLARASGITTPTREDLARLDRKRKKRTSNKHWKSPADGDARIAKMKDGRTHLAHKAEHAVDLDTGAVVAVTLQGADQGDTTTLNETLCEAGMAVAEQVGREAELRPNEAPQVNVAGIEETVTDKGYHSGAVVKRMKAYGVRSYIPEKKQKGRRNWAGKPAEQQAVYANRRRVRGEYGKSLLRRRGELVERSFAHCYETGGMRRCHLRGRDNILKRQLVHVGAFNLSLILRKLLGAGTPRELKNRAGQVFSRLLRFLLCLGKVVSRIRLRSPAAGAWREPSWPCRTPDHRPRFLSSSATDCYGRSLLLTNMLLKSAGASIPDCETDLFVALPKGSSIQVAIGECKDAGGHIDPDDAKKLAAVADAFPSDKFESYIVFSKTAPFTQDEIENCRAAQFKSGGLRVIMLSDRELEPYFVYERTSQQFEVRHSAASLEDMARVTHDVFFAPKSKKC